MSGYNSITNCVITQFSLIGLQMKFFLILVYLFSSLTTQAQSLTSEKEADDEYEKYRRIQQEYSDNTDEINELIKANKLQEAEAKVIEYEPKFARKWSIGRFGYGSRMRIGEAYLDQGNHKEALRLLESAKPGGGCGNCMASQKVSKSIQIARIYESRLNFPAAFVTYLNGMSDPALGGASFESIFGLFYTGLVMITPFIIISFIIYFFKRRHFKKNNQG